MTGTETGKGWIEWSVAFQPCSGELACGDRYFVREFEDRALAVAMDALGHGLAAADTAQLALEALDRHAAKPVAQIFEQCHQALLRSRGAAMSVASFDIATNTLTWMGIGNVEGLLVRAGQNKPATESLMVRGGVVGYQMPMLRPTTRTIHPGDVLVFTTDGIDRRFVERLNAYADPDEMATALHAQYARVTDDSLILIVRYKGARR